MDIKKIYEYSHNRYLHIYGDGYGADIYLTSRYGAATTCTVPASLTSLARHQ